jgi:signal transduction histidine kinase/BarA-like signal transduction histidine kinase
MDTCAALDAPNNNLPIEYRRAMPVLLSALWFWSLSCWLIVISDALGFELLAASNVLPVFVTAFVTTVLAYHLRSNSHSNRQIHWLPIMLVLPVLCIPVAYQNGYLPTPFAPIVMIITQCVYRGRGSKVIPYLILAIWCAAVYLSPVKEGQAYALRLLLITLIFIPITDVLLGKAEWEPDTKTRLLLNVLVFGIGVQPILAFQNYMTGESIFAPLFALVIFAACYGAIAKGKLTGVKYRSAIAITLLAAYWVAISQNGLLPVTLVAGFILFSFLLLPALEGLFFSLGLTTLSLLPLITLDPASLDFAPAPFFIRHFSVTLMIIFALYRLFRTREAEIGDESKPTPVFRGALIATATVGFLALIEGLTTARALTLELDESLGTWLINGVLIWLFVTWLSSVYLRNQQSLKQTVYELAESKEALQNQLEKQRHLFAVISHELRTPAAAISMLLKEHKGGERAESEERRLVEISEHLVDVLNDLRQVAQPDQITAVELQPTNLYELIERTTGSLTSTLNERQQKLTLHSFGTLPQALLLDRQRLRQVVTNLVKNASVHSGGTQIDIQIHSELQQQDATIRISISDNGTGLDPTMQSRLFEAFARGNTDADGTGLGLYICQQLANQMNGRLSYQPREGGGSCFTLEISAQRPNEEALQQLQPTEIQDNIRGKRVLLAEDNKTIQMITAKMLENAGASLTLAENGQAALELYQRNPAAFDLILTDIMMPQMDGYQLTRELRALGCTLPIIGVTAATIGTESVQLLEQGATQVISKPISMKSLQSALEA